MQLTLTISVAILLGAKSYTPEDDFKFGSHTSSGWVEGRDGHGTLGNMGGQQIPLPTMDEDYGRGGSNYDTRLTEDYSPCPRCVGRRYHSWQEHTWKDNAQDSDGTVVNSPEDGSALPVNSGGKARRSAGGLWDEMPAIGNQGDAGYREAGSRHGDGSMTDMLARPDQAKETNQEMMVDAVGHYAHQTGDWTSTGTGATMGPDTEMDASGNPVHKGWGTHDFVDDGGHKGNYDDGTGSQADDGPGGGRAWGSYESTDSTDWADAWAQSHLSNQFDNRRQYNKAGGEHVGNTHWTPNTHWTAYPLDDRDNEDKYRQVMSELHQNGGAQTYVFSGTNTQQELGRESQDAGAIQNVEHFSWGIVPELAMDETARYFNGETWPRTQTRYRYSFQEWGPGYRANTNMSQIHNAKPRTVAGAADEDVHQYEWGNWGNSLEVGNNPGQFANVENGGDQTVYTPRLSYSWTKRKYDSLNATTENGFHIYDDASPGPAWEWGTFNGNGNSHNGNAVDTETPGASHRNWDSTAGDWASGKGPEGYALTTAIGDGKGWNTDDKYGYGALDTYRTWQQDGARKV